MSSPVKRHLAANLASNGWTMLVGLAAVPFYVRFIGAEGYGLFLLYMMFQGLLSPLDLGMGPTLSRELARLSAGEGGAATMRNLLRTTEALYGLIALGVFVALAASCGLISQWIQPPKTLSLGEVRVALVLMGATLAAQLPLVLYTSGLMGLGRQVSLAALNMAMFAVRFGGVVGALWLIEPSVTCFFAWQAATAALHSALAGLLLWRSLPKAQGRARFDLGMLKSLRYFAAGNMGITISAVVISQVDKVILSRMLSLEWFGYYGLATTAATTLQRLTAPFFTTLFPRFTQLLTSGDAQQVSLLYHRSNQALAALVLPAAAVLCVFSYPILWLWTLWSNNPHAAANAAPLLSLLVIGMAVNGLATVPYSLQLGSGWTKLPLGANVLAALVLAPCLVVMTAVWGAAGAAAAWTIPNVIALAVSIPLTHRRLLGGEGSWKFLYDAAMPLVAGGAVAVAAWLVIPSGLSAGASVASLAGVMLLAWAAAFAVTPVTRDWLAAKVRRPGSHSGCL